MSKLFETCLHGHRGLAAAQADGSWVFGATRAGGDGHLRLGHGHFHLGRRAELIACTRCVVAATIRARRRCTAQETVNLFLPAIGRHKAEGWSRTARGTLGRGGTFVCRRLVAVTVRREDEDCNLCLKRSSKPLGNFVSIVTNRAATSPL